MHRTQAGSAALVVALLACGCGAFGHKRAHPTGTPEDAQARLSEVEARAARAPREAARAGFFRYLVASDPAGATRHWQAAPNDPLSLAGLAEVAEDRTDTATAAQRWAQCVLGAPQDPVSELCAVRLLDVEGDSAAVDDLIARAADQAHAPLAPRTARLLREAAARIAGRRAEAAAKPELEVEAWRRVGAVQHFRVAGPFGALRLFDLQTPTALDGAAPAGCKGDCFERNLDFPDGDAGLDGEPGDGDIFYASSDLTLLRGGDYLLWVEGASGLEVRIDGEPLVARSPWPREVPRAVTLPVHVGAGRHALLVRWSRAEGNRFRVVLARRDGDVSDLTSAAPARLEGWRRSSSCALGTTCTAKAAFTDKLELRASAQRALEEDDGDVVAAYLLARATLGDDRAAGRAAVERLVALSASGAPAQALRADQLLHDPELPDRIARARALAAVQEAARRDPQLLRASVAAAGLLRESERYDDAAQELQRAEAAARGGQADAPLPPRLDVARGRLADARGNPAQARTFALAAGPGRCDALQLLADLSRREQSAAEQQRLAEAALPCTDGALALAQLLRQRGDLPRAQELLETHARMRPAAPGRLEQVAELFSARNDVRGAVQALRRAAAVAPRSAEPLRRLAGMAELAGDKALAAEARREALRRAPGDLALRHQLAEDEGVRLMRFADRDVGALLRAPAQGVPPGSSALRLLDQGAAQMFPDGGGIERVHTITRVFDKQGITRYGEVGIPGDAQVLALRTIKPDGRILEPESIPEKETISLPGLEVGDTVEIDFLRGIGPRGPDLPGYTLSGFFFRDTDTPALESSYEVVAPTLEVDAHNLKLPQGSVTTEGNQQHFRYAARDVPPLQQEPHQPAENEFMPWVQVGAGAAQPALIKSIADWALLRARPSAATDALAARVSGSPRARAEALYAAITAQVRGRSQGTDLSTPAPHVLAQERGNRLLPLKAALAAAGIPSHLVLLRTFGQDPAPYRFARNDLYSYAVLRIDLPEGPLWVDSMFRLAPFGELPTYARGVEGYALPEPGEPGEPGPLRTPASFPGAADGRALHFDLTLDATGAAQGTSRDEYRGFEAASLKDALERMDAEQRKQAVEQMLGHSLRGVTLEDLKTEHEDTLGGPAALQYRISAQLGREDARGELSLPASLNPARLSRHWAQKAERNTPLLVDAPELNEVHVALTLPPGAELAEPLAPVSLQTPFGVYTRDVRREGAKLLVDEALRMPEQRVAPAAYAGFASFCKRVDEAQSQDLRVRLAPVKSGSASGAAPPALPPPAPTTTPPPSGPAASASAPSAATGR